MAYIDKSALWAVVEEVTYGTTPAINYATDMVEFIDPSMDGEIERIEREVLKNSLVKAQSLLGKETSTGTLPLEVSTTDGSGDLNGSVLYKSALGVEIPAVVSEVTTINTATTITVASGAAYAVGQQIKATDGASAFDYRTITGISGNDLSVSPDFTIGTNLITAVEGLRSYVIGTPATAATSFSVQEYMEDGAANVEYTYAGCVVNSLGIEFPIANIVKASFGIVGAGFAVADTVTDQVKQCNALIPHIAKNMTFTYNATPYDIADLSVNVDSDVQDIEAVTTQGITNKIITGKSTVGGSFNLEYTGKALFDVYKAGTAGILNVTSTASNGKRFGVYAPKVTLSGVSKSIDNSVYKDNVDFECLSSDACVDGIEDAITIWFE